jgi:hypothetical protein
LTTFCKLITKWKGGGGCWTFDALKMTGDYKMFNSLNSNASEYYVNIIFGDNGSGKFVGLGKLL